MIALVIAGLVLTVLQQLIYFLGNGRRMAEQI